MKTRTILLTRELLENHLPSLLEMDRATIGERWTAEHFRLDLPKKWTCSRLTVDVAGRPVGFAILSVKGAALHLHRLVVEPGLRGQGIGTRLMHAVAQVADAMDAKEITLKVARSNTDAIWLYQRLGFRCEPSGPFNLACAVPASMLLHTAATTDNAVAGGC